MANLRANKIVSTTGSNAITGSVEFDGTGDYLVPSGSDFGLSSSEDFTLEMWIHATSFDNSSTYSEVIRQGTNNAATDGMYFAALSAGTMEWRLSGTTKTSTNKMTAGSWNHIAVCRDSGAVYISVNGLTENFGSVTNSSTTSAFRIGANFEGTQFFKGHLSNVRFIKGTALYTSNFIPPTSKLKNLPGTVLLCCQDNESVTTEATGKTITANGDPTATRFTPQVGSDGGLVFDGATKVNTQNYFYLATGTTEDRVPINNNYGSRGVFGGGLTSAPTAAATNVIDYVTISSTGNAVDFGDITTSTLRLLSGCSSSTRGIFAGGFNSPVNINNIQYITLASTGNTIDTSDLTSTRRSMSGLANETRGIFAGGNPITNTIEYITIASLGNSSDFGDIITTSEAKSGLASPTRGIIAGGESPSILNAIDYITIASTGNSQDFGDLTQGRSNFASATNTVRGIFAGGETPTFVNTVDYVIIATIGNASDFGDLSQIRRGVSGSSSAIRGVFAGGSTDTPVSNTAFNTIDYISILTTANAFDFGDLTVSRWQSQYGIISSGHGGLG